MNIFFQIKNVELPLSIKEHIANRLYGMNKFFTPHAQAYVDVEKTHPSNNGPDLYYTSIMIQDGAHKFFTEDWKEDIRKSFDHSYGELFSIVRNERSKSRSLLKRMGSKFKKILRG